MALNLFNGTVPQSVTTSTTSQQGLPDFNSLFEYDENSGTLIWKQGGKKAGTLDSTGYRRIKVFGKTYAAHRIIWFMKFGEFPKNEIDHINGRRDDNRFDNLREASRSQNLQNLRTARKDNRSGYLGVSVRKDGRFLAQIRIEGKHKHLGLFTTAEEAHNAYLSAKRTYHPRGTL